MTTIGEATRIHSREAMYRGYYRTYRNLWFWERQWVQPGRTHRTFLMALTWRARWSALAEIIEAEKRRERRERVA